MNNDTTTTMNNEEQEGYVQKIKEQLVSEKQPFWIENARLKHVKGRKPRALVYDTGDTKMGYGLKWNSKKDAKKEDEIAFYPSIAVECEKENQDYIDNTYSIELKAHKRKTNICARFLVEKALKKPGRNGIPYTAAFANFANDHHENAELDYIHKNAKVIRNNKNIKIYDERDLEIGDFFNLTLYAKKKIRQNTPVLWNYKGDHYV